MKGRIENIGNTIMYTFKRHVQPGQSIDLEDIYKIVGFKQGFKFDEAFIDWLRKTLNPNIWKLEVSNAAPKKMKYQAEVKNIEFSDKPLKIDSVEPLPDVKDVVDAPFREARLLLNKFKTKDALENLLKVLKEKADKGSLLKLVEKKLIKFKKGE